MIYWIDKNKSYYGRATMKHKAGAPDTQGVSMNDPERTQNVLCTYVSKR